MSKELVISSNRHETRVAILEEDQLVEIYFQRSNEYSLAGSVHKGRVTRVLPGMQSAFVDLGLERDTFLYVSDFFEDHSEEYDKVTGGNEERPARAESRGESRNDQRSEGRGGGGRNRGGGGGGGGRHERYQQPASTHRRSEETPQQQPVEGGEAEMVASPIIEGSDAIAEPVSLLPQSGEAEAGASAPAGDGQSRPPRDRNDDRRGGRRGRRRRGRGRGFPESKYAADVPPTAGGEASEGDDQESDDGVDSVTPAAVEEEVLILPGESLAQYVLPGESLAKYRHAPSQAIPSAEAGETHHALQEVPVEVPPDTILTSEDPAEHPSANAIPDAPLHPERFHLLEEEPLVAEIEHSAPSHEAGVGYPIQDHVPVVHEDHSGRASDEEEPIHRLEILDDEEDRDIQEMIFESDAEADADAAQEAAESGEIEAFLAPEHGEEIEEAEITEGEATVSAAPQEARLREGGGRYPRQGGRRMRRGGRGHDRRSGGGGAGGNREGGREAAAPRPVSDAPIVAPPPRPTGTGMPSISDLLKEGQEIIVQIAKEPLGQKGARITSHIALPGRFVVYMPTLDHMGVSRKIASDEERHRLKRILQNARAAITGGCIIRTAGEGKTDEEITADITFLYNLWLDIRQKAEKRPAPLLLHHDLDIVQRILRDQFNESFKAIWVDNEEMYESVMRFVERFQPALIGKVKLYTRPIPIFDAFNVTPELEKALRPKVWLKSGGYLVINQTEALVAIDINTGKFVGKSNRLEDTIVKTNIEAVKEIVRQVRLRDLGGIIVIDFIDMDERKNRAKVMQALEEAMRQDRAPYKILQFNDFGLVAITRKRVKQSLERALCAPCPYCEGAGSVKAVPTVLGEILQEAHKIAPAVEGSNVVLRCNPEVAKVLKSHHNLYLEELEEILKRPVLVKSDATIHQEKFDLA